MSCSYSSDHTSALTLSNGLLTSRLNLVYATRLVITRIVIVFISLISVFCPLSWADDIHPKKSHLVSKSDEINQKLQINQEDQDDKYETFLEEQKEQDYHYASQVKILDLITLSLAIPTQGMSMIGWVFGPLVIHTINQNYRSAAVSPLMRIAFPLSGTLIGAQIGCEMNHSYYCGLGEGLLGLAIGSGVAMYLDWGISKRPAKKKPRLTFQMGSIQATPLATVGDTSKLQLGLMGTY